MQTCKSIFNLLDNPTIWNILKQICFDMNFFNSLKLKIDGRLTYLYLLNNFCGSFLYTGDFIVNNKMRRCLFDNRFAIKEPKRFRTGFHVVSQLRPAILSVGNGDERVQVLTLKDSDNLLAQLRNVVQKFKIAHNLDNCGFASWKFLKSHSNLNLFNERFLAICDHRTTNITRLEIFKKTEVCIEYILMMEPKKYKPVGNWCIKPYVTKIINISY